MVLHHISEVHQTLRLVPAAPHSSCFVHVIWKKRASYFSAPSSPLPQTASPLHHPGFALLCPDGRGSATWTFPFFSTDRKSQYLIYLLLSFTAMLGFHKTEEGRATKWF